MRILFVEDDPMNRRVVKDMLLMVGANMAEAEDAETGLSMIEEGEFDLVLMDLRLPNMDGLTAIEHVRARHDTKARLPIIVVTADTALHIRDRCMARGADEVIMKPVAMKQLFNSIGTILVASKKKAAA
jgi:CheY-like chemotaxis protein